ncbi:hypothetical protein FHQ08_12935 [Lactobacillus sp. CC-MHH1034]|nr:hypothetical protein [Agrilactobacillus fermenti]
MKQALKLITKRNRGVSLDTVLKEIKRKMRGWLRYYSIGRMKGFLKAPDRWPSSDLALPRRSTKASRPPCLNLSTEEKTRS